MAIWGSGGRIKFTQDGGLAVRYINKTGAASVRGYVVSVDSTQDDSVKLLPIDDQMPIGVFLDSGVPDGAPAWVVVSGRAYVYFWASTTRGHFARGGLTADTGEVAGQALSEASPASATNHFYEIGHVLESRTGAGLALVNLHFN